MPWAGAHDCDALVADRDGPAHDGRFAVAMADGGPGLRRLAGEESRVFLLSWDGRKMDITFRGHVFVIGIFKING